MGLITEDRLYQFVSSLEEAACEKGMYIDQTQDGGFVLTSDKAHSLSTIEIIKLADQFLNNPDIKNKGVLSFALTEYYFKIVSDSKFISIVLKNSPSCKDLYFK